MRKNLVVAGAVLLLVLGGVAGWYAFSPAWTVQAMMDAARDGDEAGFSRYVDYPSLRADMKSELAARLNQQARQDPSPQGKLGLAVGMALLEPMVDRLVSPKAMEQAFAQLAAEKKRERAGAKRGAGARMPEIRRDGFSRFHVAARDRPESGLVFERQGLGWKLVGIDLPQRMTVAADRS
ncbi:DUF2939 domain-containing protein [Sphingomonas parva]|uniref:DUF2939 domain-containing protein n=1 Tax=Sphingomonas parva TaxID=2555898 RepID=A0A4Y8ZSE6_9SPHN|nr:DUF2939 domain-containing protein [Sphingomonas parva]TFI58950.1 DUF2939 domain-containing protein [Sphingomonas parva]